MKKKGKDKFDAAFAHFDNMANEDKSKARWYDLLDPLLEFMRDYLREFDNMPRCKDICAEFGFKSVTTAHLMIKELKDAGKIEGCGGSVYRFTRKKG
jgi:hypothetical protein